MILMYKNIEIIFHLSSLSLEKYKESMALSVVCLKRWDQILFIFIFIFLAYSWSLSLVLNDWQSSTTGPKTQPIKQTVAPTTSNQFPLPGSMWCSTVCCSTTSTTRWRDSIRVYTGGDRYFIQNGDASTLWVDPRTCVRNMIIQNPLMGREGVSYINIGSITISITETSATRE